MVAYCYVFVAGTKRTKLIKRTEKDHTGRKYSIEKDRLTRKGKALLFIENATKKDNKTHELKNKKQKSKMRIKLD